MVGVALKRGDTIIVTHGELGRPRPAIVVQADELGPDTSSVLICPLTSVLTDKMPTRPIIEPNGTSGLRVQSQIMTDKMAAVPRHRIKEVIGSIDGRTAEQLDRALLTVLGLDR